MKSNQLPGDLQQLIPLTPAVFFVLFSLADGEKHGYAIMQQTSALSDGKFRMGPATLYTTLQRLLELALIEEVVDVPSSGDRDSRRRYYRLNDAGKTVLDAELSRMDSVVRLAKEKRLVFREAE